MYGPCASCLGHKSGRKKKQGSITYNADRENKVCKIFILSLGLNTWGRFQFEQTSKFGRPHIENFRYDNHPSQQYTTPKRDRILICFEMRSKLSNDRSELSGYRFIIVLHQKSFIKIPFIGCINSGNPLNSLQGLLLLVYTAAETNTRQFIELVFNSSAGKVVFNAYRYNSPLPEDVARAFGHEDTAQYLESISKRYRVYFHEILILNYHNGIENKPIMII